MPRYPSHHPYRWLLLCALPLLALLVSWTASVPAQTPKRGPVPSEALVAKKEKLIKGLYPEYAKTQDAAGKQALASRLLQEALDTFDDPAGKYVLLREARAWAAKAGDATTALQALDELSQWYTVDTLDLKLKTLA